ncbi:hypothetical protein Q5P01_000057 [Channa striata]|uniref:Uncharacterized protein n=1 Tax=Channa striata TaxID=64152 RepID=A0AA88IIW6_CHASR|nr:hypothetical protein Q5P01_000057 [Channa striata]
MSCQIVGCRDCAERRHGAPDIRTRRPYLDGDDARRRTSPAPRRTRIRRKLITAIAVLTVTLVLASGSLPGSEWDTEAIGLGLLDRCGRQNEFTVPARVKFHKAIRCFKGSKQYKRAPAGPRKQGVSGLQGFKSDTPECRRPRGRHGLGGSDIQQDGRRREVGGEIRGLERRCRSRCRAINAKWATPWFRLTNPALRYAKPWRSSTRPRRADQEFLDTWGYGFVSEVGRRILQLLRGVLHLQQGRQESLTTLLSAAETGANFKVEGFARGQREGARPMRHAGARTLRGKRWPPYPESLARKSEGTISEERSTGRVRQDEPALR